MSVELLDSPRFYGYRVRRQIGGKAYQEYLSLIKDGKRLKGMHRILVKNQAELRDTELKKLQSKNKKKLDKTVKFNGKGQVKGILFRMKKERSGRLSPVFQVGVFSRLDDKVVSTTVSINRHGRVAAWQRAVNFYCEHKLVSKRTKAYEQLISQCPTGREIEKLIKS